MRSVMVMFAVAVAAPMAAQAPLPPTTPRFVEITRLAQEGYGDSARAVIARILAQTKPTDAAFAEALYTSAAVAKTPGACCRSRSAGRSWRTTKQS